MYPAREMIGKRGSAFALVLLVMLLPWGGISFSPKGPEALPDGQLNREDVSSKSWGINGSNDTGWFVLEATGADPENGTPALGDLMMEFAPGAVINNLTLEISVNGLSLIHI